MQLTLEILTQITILCSNWMLLIETFHFSGVPNVGRNMIGLSSPYTSPSQL